MEVLVNDYRGRNRQHDIDAMIHDAHDPCSPEIGRQSWWVTYPSREEAEADIGVLAFTCQNCFPGQGRVLNR